MKLHWKRVSPFFGALLLVILASADVAIDPTTDPGDGGGISGDWCMPPTSQTRVACEDYQGYCQPTAWNYKIYYTKSYKCCYNSSGQYTKTVSLGQTGPTSTNDQECCQNLETVTFTDGHWSLPCDRNHQPPTQIEPVGSN